MTNGRKSFSLVKSHELISHFIRLYLVPLPPFQSCNFILENFSDNLRPKVLSLRDRHSRTERNSTLNVGPPQASKQND